ncbi:MAG: hypothetical protein JWM37_45 [Candidatus Saccharibacteria bacterium]|nr:hypothetical protein [Candidatus Saccharibacteria bacterium]
MTFNDYQDKAITTDTYGGKMTALSDFGFIEKSFGLVGEAGEVAEKLKKIFRDKAGELSPEDRAEILKELGDVLWYVSALARYLDCPLEDVAAHNLEKVLSRQQRGQTGGSGDNR